MSLIFLIEWNQVVMDMVARPAYCYYLWSVELKEFAVCMHAASYCGIV